MKKLFYLALTLVLALFATGCTSCEGKKKKHHRTENVQTYASPQSTSNPAIIVVRHPDPYYSNSTASAQPQKVVNNYNTTTVDSKTKKSKKDKLSEKSPTNGNVISSSTSQSVSNKSVAPSSSLSKPAKIAKAEKSTSLNTSKSVTKSAKVDKPVKSISKSSPSKSSKSNSSKKSKK